MPALAEQLPGRDDAVEHPEIATKMLGHKTSGMVWTYALIRDEQMIEATTQAVLMSICRTLRLRGHDPLQTIAAALRTRLQTGHLPPLPPATVADG